MTRRFLPILFIGLFALFSFSYLSQPAKAQSEREPFEVILDSQNSVGQTFFALYDGLQTVTVFITPREGGSGTLHVELLASPDSTDILAAVDLPLAQFPGADYYDFSFPAAGRSTLEDFYVRFRLTGPGKLAFATREAAAYPEGALYINDQPEGAQLEFRLGYQPKARMVGIARQMLGWLEDLLLSALLFVIPGWAVLTLVWKGFAEKSLGEKLGISAGLSTAQYPVIFLLADWAGVSLGRSFMIGWAALGAAVVLSAWVRGRRGKRFKIGADWVAAHLDDIVLVLLFGLILFSRFWAIRAVPAPMGSDSIQHGAITQLILDNGGLFQSWLPYAPYKSFTTHFGFHVLAAVYSWLSGRDALQSILIAGQSANALAVFALYPLAMLVTGGKRWAGVGAVAFAGLLSTMPAMLVNYGRYPQLAGMLILPASIWLTVEAISTEKDNRAAGILLSGVTLAGMFLSYYRLPFFYVAFLLVWLACWGIPRYGWKLRPWLTIFARLALAGAVAVVFALPWIIGIIAGRLSNEEIHGSIREVEDVIQDYQIWKSILFFAPLPMLISGLLGMGVSIMRRNLRQLAVAAWLLLLFLLVSFALLNIPGTNLMQSTAVIYSVYIPISILGGIFLAETAGWAARYQWRYTEYLLAGLIILVGLTGLPEMSKISNPYTFAFLTRPDMRAMEWIRQNTAPDASFFVEGQPFKVTSVIGGDGGWWLPVLTGRQNSMPPQYALVLEYPYENDYNERVVGRIFNLKNEKLSQAEGVRMLCQEGFDYLYIGERQIYVDRRDKSTFFTVEELSASPYYRRVYSRDLVSIFELNQDACKGTP